mgnify:CR=1 FL=1
MAWGVVAGALLHLLIQVPGLLFYKARYVPTVRTGDRSLLQLGNENYSYWWLVVIPSLAMFMTVTVFNLVGSGLTVWYSRSTTRCRTAV